MFLVDDQQKHWKLSDIHSKRDHNKTFTLYSNIVKQFYGDELRAYFIEGYKDNAYSIITSPCKGRPQSTLLNYCIGDEFDLNEYARVKILPSMFILINVMKPSGRIHSFTFKVMSTNTDNHNVDNSIIVRFKKQYIWNRNKFDDIPAQVFSSISGHVRKFFASKSYLSRPQLVSTFSYDAIINQSYRILFPSKCQRFLTGKLGDKRLRFARNSRENYLDALEQNEPVLCRVGINRRKSSGEYVTVDGVITPFITDKQFIQFRKLTGEYDTFVKIRFRNTEKWIYAIQNKPGVIRVIHRLNDHWFTTSRLCDEEVEMIIETQAC